MKLNRMLGITMEILSKRRVTATELATRFEVSNRTIYRDIELINEAGIPIVSYTGADGGFEIMEGFYLTKQHFSLEDLSVIYNLLKGMSGALGGTSNSIMSKLSSLQPSLQKHESSNPMIFDMPTSESEKQVIYPLYKAINDHKVIAFSYMSATGSSSERKVEPLKLYWERGKWYLEAYCLMRQGLRLFRLSRISELSVTDERYQQRDVIQREDQEEPLGMEVHLRFNHAAKPRVLDEFGEACTVSEDHIDVHTTFYVKDYAVSVVLSYGSKVMVISPDELKQEVLKTVTEIQTLYV
ncbi:helix-turn-helix transcriptional regulator [Bacillus horti]|uniref:DNA-binding transcriptional regulator YafY n=1 Tax=Caldalkalibacillus horti TaxID=77523 RepID=A0ABT9VVI6_9BACI|nr:YafY family protein [Bacillus horti]MDQ0165007.1 putative DNA-binding transcriptional regulator YafY [Bacillus horti]